MMKTRFNISTPGMRTKLLLAGMVMLCLAGNVHAQNMSISETGTQPDSSAMLHIQSTSRGLLIPRMTESQKLAISNAANGLIVFQSDGIMGLYIMDSVGGSWKLLVDSSILADNNFITDQDNDTKIQVEESVDEDRIRFDVGGIENYVLDGRRLHVLNTGSSVYIGLNAGNSDNSGSNTNVAIGERAMESTTSGTQNVALGYYALRNNGTGYQNIAIGYQAMNSSSSSGNSNVAVGHASGLQNTNPIGNVTIGHSTSFHNATGDYNTYIGYQAGYGVSSTSQSRNVFIGRQSGYYETTSDKLYIENSNDTASPLIWGDFANNRLSLGGEVGIGTKYAEEFVDVQGTSDAATGTGSTLLSLRDSRTTATTSPNYVLAINRQNSNTEALYLGNDGNNDAIIAANNGDLRIGRDASGTFTEYMRVENGSGEIGVGTTLPNDRMHMVYNGNIRYRSESTTNGYSGFVAENTMGEYFMGVQGAADPYPGEFHIYQNSGGGGQRLVIDASGRVGINESNPAYLLDLQGFEVMLQLQSTSNAYQIMDAGNTYASYMLHREAGVNKAITGTDGSDDSYKIWMGNATGTPLFTGTATGNVGISTTTPSVKLQVDGGTDAALASGGYIVTNDPSATNIAIDDNEIMARNNGAESPLYINNDGGDVHVHNAQGTTTAFIIQDDGSVGIGNSAPAGHLHVTHPTGVGSGIYIENASGGGDRWEFYHYTTDDLVMHFNAVQRGSFSATNGVYTSSSDASLKNSIENYDPVLNKVMDLSLKSYLFNWQDPSESKQVGFIAQEVQQVFPHLVYQNIGDESEGSSTLTLDYSGFGPLAIKAIQEQQAIIEELKARIEALENQIER